MYMILAQYFRCSFSEIFLHFSALWAANISRPFFNPSFLIGQEICIRISPSYRYVNLVLNANGVNFGYFFIEYLSKFQTKCQLADRKFFSYFMEIWYRDLFWSKDEGY